MYHVHVHVHVITTFSATNVYLSPSLFLSPPSHFCFLPPSLSLSLSQTPLSLQSSGPCTHTLDWESPYACRPKVNYSSACVWNDSSSGLNYNLSTLAKPIKVQCTCMYIRIHCLQYMYMYVHVYTCICLYVENSASFDMVCINTCKYVQS